MEIIIDMMEITYPISPPLKPEVCNKCSNSITCAVYHKCDQAYNHYPSYQYLDLGSVIHPILEIISVRFHKQPPNKFCN